MEIRTGTAQAPSVTAGSISFGQPFKNACDFLLVLWFDNTMPSSPPNILGPLLGSPPTPDGFSYPAIGSPHTSTIVYIAVGH